VGEREGTIEKANGMKDLTIKLAVLIASAICLSIGYLAFWGALSGVEGFNSPRPIIAIVFLYSAMGLFVLIMLIANWNN